MGRGHGKGKRGGRGGGSRRQFVSSLEELEARNAREADWEAGRKPLGEGEEGEEEGGGGEGGEGEETKAEGAVAARASAAAAAGAQGGDEEDEAGSEEEEEATGGQGGGGGAGGRGSAAPAAAAAAPPPPRKTKGTEGIIETQNPNAVRAAAPKNMKAKNMDMDAPAPQLSRREREALDAERRKAHYDKLHAEGKTDEAKRDLERLALVKARREAANKAKADAEAAEAKAGGRAEASAGSGKGAGSGDGFERFGAIAIKNMNPTKLKELLKERSCSLQGSKKDLQARLVEWENDNQA